MICININTPSFTLKCIKHSSRTFSYITFCEKTQNVCLYHIVCMLYINNPLINICQSKTAYTCKRNKYTFLFILIFKHAIFGYQGKKYSTSQRLGHTFTFNSMVNVSKHLTVTVGHRYFMKLVILANVNQISTHLWHPTYNTEIAHIQRETTIVLVIVHTAVSFT